MRYTKLMMAAVLGLLGTQMAGATPTAEEAAQLGKSLTPFGAIKAGNKEGTIPEWTGGVCEPPAGYKPKKGAAGGAPYIDPFAADKPLFKITAADVTKYADKLDPGSKELFRRYPQTYFMNVYPTRRSACYPEWVYENTIKKVMNPKIVGGNVPSVTGAHAQVPFPIPKAGVEAMWNLLLRMESPHQNFELTTWMVDSSGTNIATTDQLTDIRNNYWDNNLASIPDEKPYYQLLSRSIAPASQAGTMQLRWAFQRQDLMGSPTWSYSPGQRRIRLAPEFSYDGVSATSGGILLFDEINGFDGKMDRFDFKLVGRKEMYIPYNDYELWAASGKVNTPNHLDQSFMRYELHRVWVVEANLKPGERHVQKQKLFYFDEDSWNIIVEVGIDQAGQVQHLLQWPPIQEYDKPEFRGQEYTLYDFSRRAYLHGAKSAGTGMLGPLYGLSKNKPLPVNYFTPDSVAGMGIR